MYVKHRVGHYRVFYPPSESLKQVTPVNPPMPILYGVEVGPCGDRLARGLSRCS